MSFIRLNLHTVKKPQLDGFWAFYEFSVIRMSTAKQILST